MAAKKRSKKSAAKKASKKAGKKTAAAPKRAGKKGKRAGKKKAAKAAKPMKAAAPVAAAPAPKKKGGKKKKAAAKAVEPVAASVGSKKARKSKGGKRSARATGKSKEASNVEEPSDGLDIVVEGDGSGSGSSFSLADGLSDGPRVSKPAFAGARAPAFSLLDQASRQVSSQELKGKPYILYFYPKDDTPGCTTEACAFRDSLSQFESSGVRVIGVSPDKAESHAKFSKKHGLNFTLLADTGRELAERYGVWVKKKNYGKEYMGVLRSTFLVDGKGTIRRAWHGVKVGGHVDQVLGAAAELGRA